jgi:hypothetical protein
MTILLSMALIAPSGAAFAAASDPGQPQNCTDSLGRKAACPRPAKEGRSVGESTDDIDPGLLGGGLLLLGGIAGGALALSNSGGGGGAPFFLPATGGGGAGGGGGGGGPPPISP